MVLWFSAPQVAVHADPLLSLFSPPKQLEMEEVRPTSCLPFPCYSSLTFSRDSQQEEQLDFVVEQMYAPSHPLPAFQARPKADLLLSDLQRRRKAMRVEKKEETKGCMSIGLSLLLSL
jgi:hypothetical protein